MKTMVCTKCGVKKPLSEFHWQKREGYKGTCRRCVQIEWNANYKYKTTTCMPDKYIINLLRANNKIIDKDLIPQELIKLKRTIVLVGREIRLRRKYEKETINSTGIK